MPSPNRGPATLKRLVLHLNTQTISLPNVKVTKDRAVVVLTSTTPHVRQDGRVELQTIANLGLAPFQGNIVVYQMDRWGRFTEPIGTVVHEDQHPTVPKLPYFISRLLGVISLEEHHWPTNTALNVGNTHLRMFEASSTGVPVARSQC